jgi:uncharacterized protein (DUF779 family)
MFTIKPAVRENAPITAAIIGGSGAGKTLTALKLARGLVGPNGKIGVIDTEGGRPLIYANTDYLKGADGIAFHHIEMVEPYSSERFREAFKFAEQQDCNAIVIDTISHEHEGFLEFAEREEARMSSRSDKTRSKWIKPKSERKRFYSAISSSHAHVIVTIRLNRIVDMEAKPAREIQKPECDKDLPYKLDLSVQLDAETHKATYIKVPEPLIPFIESGVCIGVEHGQLLMSDLRKQAAPANGKIMAVIKNLDEAANSGTPIFRPAWEAAWRNASEAERPELRKHLDRLKQIASTADTIAAQSAQDDDTFPGDRP